MKLWIIVVAALFLTFCSLQGRLESKLTNEWRIERFEQREAGEETVVIENAGTITLSSGGRGSQSFTTAIVHAGSSAASDFTWKNSERAVTIKTEDAEYPKVWIVVEPGRTKQLWYSTDSKGNLQIMELKKK